VNELRAQIEESKLFDPTELERTAVSALDDGPAALAQLGLGDGQLLALPVRVEGRVIGGIWLFSDGRSFARDDLERAALVVEQAELALCPGALPRRQRRSSTTSATPTTRAICCRRRPRRITRIAPQSKLSACFRFDRFKAVNDRFGRPVSSRVLLSRRTAAGSVRAIDTVGRTAETDYILLVDTGLEGAPRSPTASVSRSRSIPSARSAGSTSGSPSRWASPPSVHGESRERQRSGRQAMYLAKALGRNLV
jgi:hypothetical protein